jgi:hypothetical protein
MAGKAQAGYVRDFEAGDVADVARLFQTTFRRSGKPSPDLQNYLQDAFLAHPWSEPGIASKVFCGAGDRVSGFVGVFPARLELDGRAVSAAFAGSMVVDDPKSNPLAGARLLRSFLAGPQDLSLTETANQTALGMWQKAGYAAETAYSLNWLRILRPAAASVDVLARAASPARLLFPLGRIADRISGIMRVAPFQPSPRAASRITFADVPVAEFGNALLALAQHYPLRPQWDEDSLSWFLRQAESKRTFGYPEWRVGRSPDGSIVAAYAYFGEPGRIGWVLQALAKPPLEAELVDDLFAHAYASGCSGLRGAAHPWLLPALMSRKTMFYGRSFYVAHARDKTLLEPIAQGRALISGLAGESWTRLIGDRFD